MKWLQKRLQQSGETRHLQHRLAEIGDAIAAEMGCAVRLRHTGRVSGFDSIFEILPSTSKASDPIGMLRLNNSLRCQQPSDTELPRIRLAGPERIKREASAYRQLSGLQLAPNVLMQGRDFLINEWLEYDRFSQVLRANQDHVWQWLPTVLKSVRDMHSADVVHMDLNPGNVLVAQSQPAIAFIDFEYAALPSLPPLNQQAFDYLRLLSNLLKRRRAIRPLSANPPRLFRLIEEIVPADCRNASLPFGLHGFPGITRQDAIRTGICGTFPGLVSSLQDEQRIARCA